MDLNKANVSGADLSESSLIHADLRGADLHLSRLTHADLRDADFRGADLTHQVDLCNADLRGAELGYADLRGANLQETNLRGASVNRVNFDGAQLKGADFRNAKVGWTIFSDVDLSEVKGLENIDHLAPSSIGMDTLYLSKGRIPDVFLRGCGVPEDFILYSRSLISNPIEYYSCFISYSSKDQECAERLHADLQSKGVRCWFAPEDLKIGDKLRPSFDEAIRLHDKLMVILSEYSVTVPGLRKR